MSVSLHELVGILPVHAAIDQRKEDLLREDQPAADVEVREHSLGIHDKLTDNLVRLVKHEVENDTGVREDHPLGRAVADVTLMPERHIFEPDDGIAADKAREAGDTFGFMRV